MIIMIYNAFFILSSWLYALHMEFYTIVLRSPPCLELPCDDLLFTPIVLSDQENFLGDFLFSGIYDYKIHSACKFSIVSITTVPIHDCRRFI
jgi:hypothetical protein